MTRAVILLAIIGGIGYLGWITQQRNVTISAADAAARAFARGAGAGVG